jgi:hypothetical protein
VNVDDLHGSAKNILRTMSDAGGAHGGIITTFWPAWKMRVMQSQRLHHAYCELLAHSFARGGDDALWAHPFGPLDPRKAYAYVDRAGFRVPQDVLESLCAAGMAQPFQTGGARTLPLRARQRRSHANAAAPGLSPHVDCNPHTYAVPCDGSTFGDGESKQRWRPIQSFVGLTEVTRSARQGALQVIRGFHKEFAAFFEEATRAGRVQPRRAVHEYVALPPSVFPELAARLEDVPYPAGAAVFWDQRTVHATGPVHDGPGPREVVYAQFMPAVPLNRRLAEHQLRLMRQAAMPPDFVPRDPGAPRASPFVVLPDRTLTAEEERSCRTLECLTQEGREWFAADGEAAATDAADTKPGGCQLQ